MKSVTPHSPPMSELTSPQTLPSLSLVSIQLAIMFSLLAALLTLMLHFFHDYRLFITLGPGGTPTTIPGYLRVKALSLFTLPDPYQPGPVPRHLQHSPGYLTPSILQPRGLPRPETRGIAPHRQITQKAGPAEFAELSARINALGNIHSDRLVCRTSCFEKHASGLFATSPAKRTCGGEICHAHPSDGSLHLTLHPADAKIVLEAHWGERHPLARGGWFERFVPSGFVMIYAPRNQEEIESVMMIVMAAAWFVGGGGDWYQGKGDERRLADACLDGSREENGSKEENTKSRHIERVHMKGP